MTATRIVNIWDAIEDTPEEAENMKLRATLMMALKHHLTSAKMSQAQAAKLLGVTQPRVSDLMRGKVNLFGLDALVSMAMAAGLPVDMREVEAERGEIPAVGTSCRGSAHYAIEEPEVVRLSLAD